MSIFTPAFVLSFTLLNSGSPVVPDTTATTASALSTRDMIVLADFAALDNQSKRRMEYYASQILTDISEMSTLERAGDTAAVDRTLAHARQLAIRMATASDDYGLTRPEMLNFFLSKLGTDLTGPLPNAILSDDGRLMIFSLFEETEDSGSAARESGDYLDLLRSQDLGG